MGSPSKFRKSMAQYAYRVSEDAGKTGLYLANVFAAVITPDVATWLVESFNLRNRPVRQRNVDRLSENMRVPLGAIMLVVFANGEVVILDGQNRLLGQIKSDRTLTHAITVYACRNKRSWLQAFCDAGDVVPKTRSILHDTLLSTFPDASITRSALNTYVPGIEIAHSHYYRCQHKRGNRELLAVSENKDSKDFIRFMIDIEQSIRTVPGGLARLRQSGIKAGFYSIWASTKNSKARRNKARAFIIEYYEGIPPQNSPAIALRQVMKSTVSNNHDQRLRASLTYEAWQAHLQGKTMTQEKLMALGDPDNLPEYNAW